MAMSETTIGYISALMSMVAFGSFCVPMKGDAAKSVDVDPLVFQTYKTSMCFLTSFCVLFLGEELHFTPWGIMSGLFWIPGGVAHVIGVRTAGLAIAHGTTACMIVLVSFSWGIFVFQERLESIYSACCAILLMVIGISGMSYFSSPSSSSDKAYIFQRCAPCFAKFPDIKVELTSVNIIDSKLSHIDEEINEFEYDDSESLIQKDIHIDKKKNTIQDDHDHDSYCDDDEHDYKGKNRTFVKGETQAGLTVTIAAYTKYINKKYNTKLTPRNLGIIITGIGSFWGGSIMVPLHYASTQTKGLGFVFSFAVGASLVNFVCWILRYVYNVQCTRCPYAAYRALPSFHFRTMALPGALSGILWSIGNIGSILAVTHLGEGVGYSLTQSAMLVSGLWGIFYFHEITDRWAIQGWIMSAVACIGGILLLSYNHMPAEAAPVLKT